MASGPLSRPAGEALWRALCRPETLSPPAPPGLGAAALRFAELTSPALAAFLLERAAGRLGTVLVDPRLVEHSRLDARFTRAAQLKCIAALEAAGIPAVYLKGFANAHTLYPDPDLRLFGDLDALIRREHLARIVELLAARGFSFRPGAAPWGFQAEGSFAPFVSADGACNLDLHLDPDSYPLNRALDGARVFARARTIETGGLRLLVPAPEHAIVLCLSNAAKDKLGPFAVRKLIDLVRLLERMPKPDWAEILELLARANLLAPARAISALLARLGARLPALPSALERPPAWPASGEFERLVADYLTLFADPPGLFATLRRECLLSAAPRTALRLNARRLLGLVRPRSGVPESLPRASDGGTLRQP